MVANVTGYQNNNIGQPGGASIPLSNIFGVIPGPLNPILKTSWPATDTSAVGAGGGPVFVG